MRNVKHFRNRIGPTSNNIEEDAAKTEKCAKHFSCFLFCLGFFSCLKIK